MIISIETHRAYDFPGGGVILLCLRTSKFWAKYCIRSKLGFAERVQSESSTHYELFLKSYCLLRKKNPLPELETSHVLLKHSFKFSFPFFNAGNDYFHLFSHKINVHLISL